MSNQVAKKAMFGDSQRYQWNKKLCWEARDTLFKCVDSTENGNKYRCPDELYAYEMYCPNDFRTHHSMQRRFGEVESLLYNQDYLDKVNK